MKKIDVDQLPIYSEWPARLLGLEQFKQRFKTKEEIDREFECDKWGGLLSQIQQNPSGWSLVEADNFFLNGSQTVLSIKNDLYIAPSIKSHEYYLNEIEKRLSEFQPIQALVELGAGYGCTILNLAKRAIFSGVKLFAAEYTQSGIACLKHLSAAENIRLVVGACDFTLPSICEMNIPEKSLVYTNWAVSYVPILDDVFVDGMIKLKPAAVVHFEPCIEHYDDSLLGLLREKYTYMNDYNKNLLTLLRKRESSGDIRIIKEEPCFYGDNCFAPCSFVAWSPVV